MNSLVNLAKLAVENYLRDGRVISPPQDLSKDFLKRKSGVFVTIEKRGQLRGCIGTYLPTRESIAQEIIHNAIAAATEDYRFGPIQDKELGFLSYTVYILNEPELVKNIGELDHKKYGVIVKTALGRAGLLLPDLEDVDTVNQQIAIACQKAGIDATREKIIIYRFSTLKF